VLIFITIFIVGFLLLIINLIFGHDVDHDMGGDVGGLDHDFGHPSVFSVKMLSLLMVGFGAVGFGVRATTSASMFLASMAGVCGAIAVAAIGYVIIRAFYASQATSTISDSDLVGCTGTLIDAIGDNGMGQIACVVRGREITYLARSRDSKAIAHGTPVRVVAKVGNTVTVEPL
jgi:membrane protein implicated in regulation of membrane protease activity